MSEAMVRSQTPEEREYARYLADVETRKRRAADLQVELEALRLALTRFEAEYHHRVGSLFVELDRVRIALDEYESRIVRLQTNPSADPNQIEQEVRKAFADRYEDVHQEEEETRQYERAFERDQERPRLDIASEEEATRLYRELARRYHPNLARTEEERRRREPLMQRVNAAFRERNLAGLRALEREAGADDPAFEGRSLGEKLVWAIREVARLDEVITSLAAELAVMRASDTHQLWQRQEAGEGVIEALEADLKADLARKRDHLTELIATYRHLIDRRSA